ncbi:MAG: helix-turn-helix transcriptional regulator [Lachnospiraceae bacterium]|nr:helix-turn-helix transcriptional regulator [Lachnospiraceae bacterium]
MNIGRALRYYGRRSGLDRAEIAEKLQISKQEYGKYEEGKRVPDIDLICGMAQAFGVTTDDFFAKAMGK